MRTRDARHVRRLGIALSLVAVLAAPMAIPAAALSGPVLLADPSSGPAGIEVKVEYFWAGCGGLPAGDYTLEVYWEGTAGSPLVAEPFTYAGSGDCDIAVFLTIPSGATEGGHDLIGQLVEGKNPPIAESGVKGAFVVTIDATQPPKPTAEPEPSSGQSTPPKATERPGATDVPKTTQIVPGTDSPSPLLSGETPPSAGPLATELPASSASVPGATAPSGSLGTGPRAGPIDGIVTAATQVTSDVLLGGLTQVMLSMWQGVDPFPAPSDRGPNLSRSIGEAFEPDVAATDRNVYAVWVDTAAQRRDLLFARSVDHGYSFPTPVPIHRSAVAAHPRIVADAGHVTVAWLEPASDGALPILTMTSTDGGATWSAPTVAGSGSDFGLATAGGRDYLTWVDGASGSQIIARSLSGAPVQVSAATDVGRRPVIAASGTSVAIAWETNTGDGWDTALAVSADAGTIWTSTIVPRTYPHEGGRKSCISGDHAERRPAISMSGDDLLVAWEDTDVPQVIYRWYTSADRAAADASAPGSWLCSAGTTLATAREPRLPGEPADAYPMNPAVSTRNGTFCVALTEYDRTVGSATGVVCWDRPHLPRLSPSLPFGRPGDSGSAVVGFAGSHMVMSAESRANGPGGLHVWLLRESGTASPLSFSPGTSSGPRLATSGNNVTVVWTEETNGNRQVFFSTNPGQ